MRLAQLARKLKRTPKSIIEYLAKHDIIIEDDVNTKLQEEHLAIVLEKYPMPEEKVDIIEDVSAIIPNEAAAAEEITFAEEVAIEEAPIADVVQQEMTNPVVESPAPDTIIEAEPKEAFEKKDEVITEELLKDAAVSAANENDPMIKETVEQEITKTASKETPQTEELKDLVTTESITIDDVPAREIENEVIPEVPEREVIKAPSVQLDGPTVIGKIDLPPPPPPEMVEIDGVMMEKSEAQARKKAERALKSQKRRETKEEKVEWISTTPDRVSIKDQEKKIEEEKHAEKKRIILEKRLKEEEKAAKRENYLKQQQKNKPKVVKTKTLDKEAISEVIKEQKSPEPEVKRGPLSALWHWLTQASN